MRTVPYSRMRIQQKRRKSVFQIVVMFFIRVYKWLIVRRLPLFWIIRRMRYHNIEASLFLLIPISEFVLRLAFRIEWYNLSIRIIMNVQTERRFTITFIPRSDSSIKWFVLLQPQSNCVRLDNNCRFYTCWFFSTMMPVIHVFFLNLIIALFWESCEMKCAVLLSCGCYKLLIFIITVDLYSAEEARMHRKTICVGTYT